MSKQRCIYCDKEKPIEDFSLEHIIPDSLGGSACPDLFKTRMVCRRCNSLIGLWVDGPFIKNWFAQNDKSISAYKYIPEKGDVSVPLTYLGLIDVPICSEDEICELWLAPCGSRIYHIHKNSDERYATFIGGNPIELKKNYGRAYLFLATQKEFWIRITLFSYLSHFRKARRLAGNFNLIDKTGRMFIEEPSHEELNEIKSLIEVVDSGQHARFSIQLNSHHRFLSKVGLATGTNLFGTDFIYTQYGERLRNTLWEKRTEEYEKIGVKSLSLREKDKRLLNILSWEGAHTFLFTVIENSFVLIIYLWGNHYLHVVISDDPSIWSKRKLIGTGEVYIVIPQIGLSTNAVSLENYIAHKLKNIQLDELNRLEQLRIDYKELPSCN